MMEPVAYRVGLMAAALSSYFDGQVVGVMLTASHNPVEDNGIKLVAPTGEMLASEWEAVAESLAHCPTANLEALVERHFGGIGAAQVAIGRDTRPSGPLLFEAVQAGARRVGAAVIDVGMVTTPELHTAVIRLNQIQPPPTPSMLEEAYLSSMAAAFAAIVGPGSRAIEIVVDAANGVGASKASKLGVLLEKVGYHLRVVNDGKGEGDILNLGCGADFVKTSNCAPRLGDSVPPGVETEGDNVHYVSLDGDADRIVYFALGGAPRGQSDRSFTLIDGDRISALAARTLLCLLEEARMRDLINLGVVQTAYANGGSTEYLATQLGIPVVCVSTGVKHLHAAAHKFDIGVYFEANGHGTVLFGEEALERLRSARHPAADKILALARLAHPHVGDALADMLLVEAMLRLSGLSIGDWIGLYADRPSCLLKAPVRDRTAFRTIDADRRIVEPAGLQEAIDTLVVACPGGRAFARPSGTEDVIRVFAEALDQPSARALAEAVSRVLVGHLP